MPPLAGALGAGQTGAMIAPPDLVLHLPDPEATDRLARRLADYLAPGATILLRGPIGSGKSHFARAFIRRRLGVTGDIPSPTFTLVQSYEGKGEEVWHADLYRLGHPDEVQELGLAEALGRAICLIEWPDRLGGAAPADALELDLSLEGEGRQVVIRGAGPALRAALADG